MTRADCQALSKHHHVCWLSIPCPQHKIGGQRIIGVRDGKDIWGQPVHPSAFSYPWFQTIPYIIFSPLTLVQFSRSSLNSSRHLWGMMLDVLPVSPQQGEIACAPVDIRELLCWWSQLRGWKGSLDVFLLPGDGAFFWQSWRALVYDDTRQGVKARGLGEPHLNLFLDFCFQVSVWRRFVCAAWEQVGRGNRITLSRSLIGSLKLVD